MQRGIIQVAREMGKIVFVNGSKLDIHLRIHFFALDIQATDKALDIIKEWNSRRYITGTVKLNIPQVWHFNDDAMGVIGLVEKCFKSHIFKTM